MGGIRMSSIETDARVSDTLSAQPHRKLNPAMPTGSRRFR